MYLLPLIHYYTETSESIGTRHQPANNKYMIIIIFLLHTQSALVP